MADETTTTGTVPAGTEAPAAPVTPEAPAAPTTPVTPVVTPSGEAVTTEIVDIDGNEFVKVTTGSTVGFVRL